MESAEAIIPVVATQLKKVRSGNVLFSVIVLVVIAIMGGLNAHEARRAADRVDQATECIIEQFAEHREANRNAHRALTEAHDVTYKQEPEDLPMPVLERLEEACRPFTKR